MIRATLGNDKLLSLPKTAFLCSRRAPAGAVLKCYDWAIQQRDAGRCVISGFHSQMEKDVLHYLLKGNQPIILALARGLKARLEPELKAPLEEGRLLIITPFTADTKYVTADTSRLRNQMMIELADEIVIGYSSPGGQLAALMEEYTNKSFLFL
jgi:hypothetical protein